MGVWMFFFFSGVSNAYFDSGSLLVIERPVDTCPVTLLLRTRIILQLSCLVDFLFYCIIYFFPIINTI